MKLNRSTSPLIFTLFGLVGIAFFLFYAIRVLLPIAWVEVRFGISSIREVLIPRFSTSSNSPSAERTDAIVIPSLYIDEPVIYNVNPSDKHAYTQALKHGIAHAAGTQFPGDGGMGYYFAHSSSPSLVTQYNAVFYLLNKISLGDAVYVYHNGTRYEYVVYAKQIVDPSDTSFFRYKNAEESIILQTCWPPGTTIERLLVFAKRKTL